LWLGWFGVARLAATVASVVVVAVAVFWLVRAPAPPAEATLPIATDQTTGRTGGQLTESPGGSVQDQSAAPTEAPPVTAADNGADATRADDPIVVHVAGNVAVPGIYRLDRERRVHDAIELAGGGTSDADLDAVNLAQELLDGQRLYVPAIGETDAAALDVVSPSPTTGSAAAEAAAGPVDINRATPDELDTLPGVGPSTAHAIVDERERNGPFATVDELERVPGIGPAKLDRLRDLVVV
jgi:competence protein ComEA